MISFLIWLNIILFGWVILGFLSLLCGIVGNHYVLDNEVEYIDYDNATIVVMGGPISLIILLWLIGYDLIINTKFDKVIQGIYTLLDTFVRSTK